MHIRIKRPTKAESLFFNYKQYFSIVLQGVADSESRFIFINISAYGKQSKFSASTVYVPWGRLSLWKWVPEISPGVKAAGAFGWRPTTLVVPKVEKIRALNYPEPLGPPRPVAGYLYFT